MTDIYLHFTMRVFTYVEGGAYIRWKRHRRQHKGRDVGAEIEGDRQQNQFNEEDC